MTDISYDRCLFVLIGESFRNGNQGKEQGGYLNHLLSK